MKVTYYLDSDTLIYGPDSGGGTTINVECRVKNELNGKRPLSSKAVFTEPSEGKVAVPYMPRQFPRGDWHITYYKEKSNDYEAPGFIGTDAHQKVEAWLVKKDGTYDRPSGKWYEDWGYGFHNSSSPTTLGCGRILGELDGRTKYSTKEQKAFSDAVRAALAIKEQIDLKVV